jgi:hypothetical protein
MCGVCEFGVTKVNIVHLVLGICLFGWSGCQVCERQRNTEPMERTLYQKRHAPMLTVNNFTIGKDYLTLDYCVQNSSPQDIWICDDVDISAASADRDPNRDVETVIMGETLRIRLRFDRNSNYDHEMVFAGYRRLPHGKLYSGRIRLYLPIRNWSPLYLFHIDFGKPKKSVTLNQVVLELGYFAEDLPALIAQSKERGWFIPGWQPQSQDRDVVLVSNPWEGRELERSVQTVINNVQIPGRLGGLDGPGPSPASTRWP